MSLLDAPLCPSHGTLSRRCTVTCALLLCRLKPAPVLVSALEELSTSIIISRLVLPGVLSRSRLLLLELLLGHTDAGALRAAKEERIIETIFTLNTALVPAEVEEQRLRVLHTLTSRVSRLRPPAIDVNSVQALVKPLLKLVTHAFTKTQHMHQGADLLTVLPGLHVVDPLPDGVWEWTQELVNACLACTSEVTAVLNVIERLLQSHACMARATLALEGPILARLSTACQDGDSSPSVRTALSILHYLERGGAKTPGGKRTRWQVMDEILNGSLTGAMADSDRSLAVEVHDLTLTLPIYDTDSFALSSCLGR